MYHVLQGLRKWASDQTLMSTCGKEYKQALFELIEVIHKVLKFH